MKRIWIFLGITFGLSWGALGVAYGMGYRYTDRVMLYVLMFCMLCPAIGSLLTRLITREGFGRMYLRPRFRGNAGCYLLGWLLPLIYLALGAAVYFVVFPSTFDGSGSILRQMLLISGATAEQIPLLIGLQFLQILLLAPVINLPFTMGEELGWRGYLLPRLAEHGGNTAALLKTGVIWGLWHAPMITLGHNYGTEYFGYPWLGILLMTLFCIGFGAFEGYITLRSGSAWPAAIAHSALNGSAAFPAYFAFSSDLLLGPMLTGILAMSVVLVGAVFFLRGAGKLPQAEPASEQRAG